MQKVVGLEHRMPLNEAGKAGRSLWTNECHFKVFELYSVVNGEPATKKLLRMEILFGQYFRKDGLGSGLWTFLTTTHSLNFIWYTDIPGKYAILITCFMK